MQRFLWAMVIVSFTLAMVGMVVALTAIMLGDEAVVLAGRDLLYGFGALMLVGLFAEAWASTR